MTFPTCLETLSLVEAGTRACIQASRFSRFISITLGTKRNPRPRPTERRTLGGGNTPRRNGRRSLPWVRETSRGPLKEIGAQGRAADSEFAFAENGKLSRNLSIPVFVASKGAGGDSETLRYLLGRELIVLAVGP